MFPPDRSPADRSPAEAAAAGTAPDLALLPPDTNYVVIGSSGWLGRVALDLLERAFGTETPRRVRAFGSARRAMRLRSGRELTVAPLSALADLPSAERYAILHFAFITRDRLQATGHEAFVAGNEGIRRTVIAAMERLEVAGLFLPSSGAVFGPGRAIETDMMRNPYGALKLRDEEEFALLAWRRSFPATIARIFNLAGPHINKHDTYALASMLTAALKGGPIRIRAGHPVIRSYADARDVLRVSLASLSERERPPVVMFETAGERQIEIGALAQLAARTVGGDIAIERPEVAAEPADRYVGDGEAYFALAARHNIRLRLLAEQIADTAAFLRGGGDEPAVTEEARG